MMVSDRRLMLRELRLAELPDYPPWWRPFARRRWCADRASIMAMDVSMFAELLADLYPKESISRMAQSRYPSLALLTKTK